MKTIQVMQQNIFFYFVLDFLDLATFLVIPSSTLKKLAFGTVQLGKSIGTNIGVEKGVTKKLQKIKKR